MLMIIVLVGILLAAFGVFAWMWVRLQREAGAAQQDPAVPLADIKTMRPLGDASVDHQRLLDEQRLTYEDRLREVREELKATEAKLQESERSSGELVASLRGENESLKVKIADLEASAQKADQAAAKIDHLVVENSAFRAQIVELSAEAARLKENLARVEKEGLELKESSAHKIDAQELVEQAKAEYQRQLDNVYRQVEELRAENTKLQQQAGAAGEVDALKRQVDELSGRVRELEMTKAIQAEKNEYLQYELTKSRAQVIGLERVCEGLSPLTVMEK